MLFASHTNIIQTDSIALGNVLPVIVDLHCHLEEPSLNGTMASTLSHSMSTQFSKYLDVNHEDFNPMPAAACLLSHGKALHMKSGIYSIILNTILLLHKTSSLLNCFSKHCME